MNSEELKFEEVNPVGVNPEEPERELRIRFSGLKQVKKEVLLEWFTSQLELLPEDICSEDLDCFRKGIVSMLGWYVEQKRAPSRPLTLEVITETMKEAIRSELTTPHDASGGTIVERLREDLQRRHDMDCHKLSNQSRGKEAELLVEGYLRDSLPHDWVVKRTADQKRMMDIQIYAPQSYGGVVIGVDTKNYTHAVGGNLCEQVLDTLRENFMLDIGVIVAPVKISTHTRIHHQLIPPSDSDGTSKWKLLIYSPFTSEGSANLKTLGAQIMTAAWLFRTFVQGVGVTHKVCHLDQLNAETRDGVVAEYSDLLEILRAEIEAMQLHQNAWGRLESQVRELKKIWCGVSARVSRLLSFISTKRVGLTEMLSVNNASVPLGQSLSVNNASGQNPDVPLGQSLSCMPTGAWLGKREIRSLQTSGVKVSGTRGRPSKKARGEDSITPLPFDDAITIAL